jgi:hypothetical protein
MDVTQPQAAVRPSTSLLQGHAVDQPLSLPASRRDARLGPIVPVLVLGVRLLLPAHALHAGLADLRLSSEAHVSLEDYAAGVGLVLLALAKVVFN